MPLISPLQTHEDSIKKICTTDDSSFELDIFAFPEASGIQIPLTVSDAELRYSFFRYDVDQGLFDWTIGSSNYE